MTDAATVPHEPKGIGGWLILPMLGTLISPLLTGVGLFQAIDTFIEHQGSQTATWRYFVIGEMIVTLILIAGWIVAAVKLFQHKRVYPSLFVAMLIATVAYNAADAFAVSALFNLPIDKAAARDIGRPLFALMIWWPYMFMSRRVKNTFVN
jgi:hypothetical protein